MLEMGSWFVEPYAVPEWGIFQRVDGGFFFCFEDAEENYRFIYSNECLLE